MDADGGHQQRVSNEKSRRRPRRRSSSRSTPPGRRTGSSIAFSSTRDVTSRLFVMAADGKDVKRLTADAEADETPDLVAGRETDRVCPRYSGPDHDHERRRDRPPVDRRRAVRAHGSGLVARRELDRVRAPRARLAGTRAVADPSGRLRSASAHAPRGDQLLAHVVAGRQARGVHERSQRELRHRQHRGGGIGPSPCDAFSPTTTSTPRGRPTGKAIAFARDGSIFTTDLQGHEQQLTGNDNDSNPAWSPVTKTAAGY